MFAADESEPHLRKLRRIGPNAEFARATRTDPFYRNKKKKNTRDEIKGRDWVKVIETKKFGIRLIEGNLGKKRQIDFPYQFGVLIIRSFLLVV